MCGCVLKLTFSLERRTCATVCSAAISCLECTLMTLPTSHWPAHAFPLCLCLHMEASKRVKDTCMCPCSSYCCLLKRMSHLKVQSLVQVDQSDGPNCTQKMVILWCSGKWFPFNWWFCLPGEHHPRHNEVLSHDQRTNEQCIGINGRDIKKEVSLNITVKSGMVTTWTMKRVCTMWLSKEVHSRK